jgi:hypothetical protein
MIDFTESIFHNMLAAFIQKGYTFVSFNSSEVLPNFKMILLRHDVDLKPENSLATAKLEHSLGIKGTYYFRIIPQTLKPEIIKEIADLGHEIGYHYEDMDLVHADNLDKHIDLAYESFQKNLEILSKIVPITTICMHGSPRASTSSPLAPPQFRHFPTSTSPNLNKNNNFTKNHTT